MQSVLPVRFGSHNLPLRFCWYLQKTNHVSFNVKRGQTITTRPPVPSCIAKGNSKKGLNIWVKVMHLCRLPRCFSCFFLGDISTNGMFG